MQGGDGDDWWLESAPKANILWDDSETNFQPGGLGTTVDSTARLSRQLRDFDTLTGFDASQSTSAATGEPIVPLNRIISDANIDLIVRLERADPLEESAKCSEEKLLEEMLLGHQVSLQTCRSLRAKSNLLQGAVNSADGEVVLKVVLHIMGTLSSRHSFKLLSDHPVAFKVYANYLSATNQHSTLINLLESSGKMRQAAVLHYYLANSNKSASASKQGQNIFGVSSSHFINDKYSKYLRHHVKLLELASPLNLSGNVTGHEWLRVAANTTSQDTLGQVATSVGFSDKIYQWICLRSLCSEKKFNDVQAIFKTKTWLGGGKLKVLIPIGKVVSELEKAKAPKNEIEKYIQLVEDPMERRILETKLANMQL